MLEAFDGKKTNWEGLWYQPGTNFYMSYAINLATLRKFKGNVRIVMRKNKFFKKGSNCPNYQFCICDSKSKYIHDVSVVSNVFMDTYKNEEYISIADARSVVDWLFQNIECGVPSGDIKKEIVGALKEYAVSTGDILEEYINKENENCGD